MSDNAWVEKHRPETWSDIQGNNKAVQSIRNWVEKWTSGDAPRLLVGPPGTGKTSVALLAADELGIPLNDINLSLQRRGDELKRVARSATSTPPDHEYQLVLFDEIDNMYGSVKKDPLYEVLREAPNPIIVTANDKYEVPNPVKKACETHKFKLGVRSRKAKIREIADREDLDLSTADLNRLAQRPDLRSAINDLQTLAESDVPIGKDNRTWSEGEFSAVEALLKGDGETWRKSIGLNDDTFNRLDSAILWADHNLTIQYRGLEAGVAHQMLADADMWASRAFERQNFRYQKFGYALLEMLPDARLTEPYTGYISDDMFPGWFRHSTDKSDSNSPEANTYRKMKGERGYKFAGSYFEFKNMILPILQGLPVEERLDLAINARLDPDDVTALNLQPEDYEEYRGDNTVEEGEGWSPDSNQASVTDW